ncbi:fasciclin domain-containing protein [Erythrobacter alti]|uniref:fasciclin domain-containing protein n=1 Tax=Erythrobacter alti TaxID=1896145 RepID=UPI0030F4800C
MISNTLSCRCLTALASSALLTLAACGDTTGDAESGANGAPGTLSLAALIAENDELSTVETLVEEAGLAQAFDGIAAYTVLAPSDDALAALGEDFSGDEARPALIAVLRGHILPGYLTSEDITTAIESNGGPVEMQTMGSGTLTFAMEDDVLKVSSDDGATSAAITEEMLGANGVILPIDAVLKQVETHDQ